ncbi:MAG: hypothetical protein KDA66_09345 [Planctomycetaceae bacterium]|nr:hypothetical protein [Planctomycetaceae bacterium]
MRAACITQEELIRLRTLKSAQREYEQLRQQVREKYMNGAPIVAGELSLTATVSEQRSFSSKSLAALVGREEMLRLRDQLEPKCVVCLSVIDSSTSSELEG